MSVFQIIAICFALFMVYVVNIHRKKSRLSPFEVSFWYSLWFLFIAISLLPDLLLGIAQVLQFSRVFDLLIVGALMILSVIVISNYFLQKENQKKLEDFVRHSAIKKLQSQSEKK